MKQFNKTTAAVVAGAAVTVLGTFWSPGPEALQAVQTLLVALLVYLVPNT